MIRSLGWVWYCLTSTLSDPCGWLAPLQWPRVYLCMADWYVGWVSGAWPLCLSNLYKFILHSACTTNIIILIINNTPATIISCVWGRGRNWRHWHPLLIRTQSHIWSGLILDQAVWLSPEYVAASFFFVFHFHRNPLSSRHDHGHLLYAVHLAPMGEAWQAPFRYTASDLISMIGTKIHYCQISTSCGFHKDAHCDTAQFSDCILSMFIILVLDLNFNDCIERKE